MARRHGGAEVMGFDPDTLDFAQPQFLWLLLAPAALLAMLAWRVLVHRAESHRFATQRSSPVRESFTFASGLGFWFCVLLACSLCIVALSRPQARVVVTNRAGADLIVLQDGSASMYVSDVGKSRWQRSQAFLRVLAESLSWRGDRMALALFARRAAPQVRLTRDPNALFFFFDHLGETPPFSLENDTTWDTNIEEGLDWGLKLVDTDEALLGRSPNSRAFVVVSDGQAWSGRIERALRVARERGIPVHVVGVGTLSGGRIPQPKSYPGQPPQPVIRSVLDRKSLREIAWAGGGEYFEIGHEPDPEIAFRLISSVRKHAAAVDAQPSHEPLYWQFLVGAAAALGAGTLLLRMKTELWWQTVGLSVALSLLVAVV
jgi:Ca-activated chloride channel family protein